MIVIFLLYIIIFPIFEKLIFGNDNSTVAEFSDNRYLQIGTVIFGESSANGCRYTC